MKVTRKSLHSGQINTLEIPCTEEQMERFIRREDLVQNIFPDLTKEQREFIMTGITAEEWLEIFPPGWDGEDEEELTYSRAEAQELTDAEHVVPGDPPKVELIDPQNGDPLFWYDESTGTPYIARFLPTGVPEGMTEEEWTTFIEKARVFSAAAHPRDSHGGRP